MLSASYEAEIMAVCKGGLQSLITVDPLYQLVNRTIVRLITCYTSTCIIITVNTDLRYTEYNV